jgi:hypothetical protein
MISAYNAEQPPAAPRNLINMVGKRLTMRGYIILDHDDRQPAFAEEVGAWVRDGRVKFRETFVEGGVEAAPQAFIDLLRGANTGKMVVKF